MNQIWTLGGNSVLRTVSATIRRQWRCFLIFSLLLVCLPIVGFADPITEEQACQAAKQWVSRLSSVSSKRMSSNLDGSVRSVKDKDGNVIFYIVTIDGVGVVATSADTGVVPVIAFSETADIEESFDNPLYSILVSDLSNRMAFLRSVKAASATKRMTYGVQSVTGEDILTQYEAEWSSLLNSNEVSNLRFRSASSDDVRVEPFLTRKWGQIGIPSVYTPSAVDGDFYAIEPNANPSNNFPCGCVATAVAQTMHYLATKIYKDKFRTAYPSKTRECKLMFNPDPEDPAKTKEFSEFFSTKGGKYNWESMPVKSDEGANEALSKLCYDLAVLMKVEWGWTNSNDRAESSFGSTDETDVSLMFEDYFGLKHAYKSQEFPSRKWIQKYIFSNLDARLPVIVTLFEHMVVADGYKFMGEVPYTHLNMGWDGLDDNWYNLPTVSIPDIEYESKDYLNVFCNLFPDNSKTIISGRVLDKDGTPLSEVDVHIAPVSDPSNDSSTKTDKYGIYYFSMLEKGNFAISTEHNGETGKIEVTIADEYDNSWGNDITIGVGTEVCFLIDSTGSMGGAISSVKNSAISMINDFCFDEDGNPTGNRVAVMEFRDKGDVFEARTRTPLTTDASVAISAINGISVSGGGDAPEAVYNAIYKAISGSVGTWNSANRNIILMTDNAPHDPDLVSGHTKSDIEELLKDKFSATRRASGDEPPFSFNTRLHTVYLDDYSSTAQTYKDLATSSFGTCQIGVDPEDAGEAIVSALAASKSPITIGDVDLSFISPDGWSKSVYLSYSSSFYGEAVRYFLPNETIYPHVSFGNSGTDDMSSFPFNIRHRVLSSSGTVIATWNYSETNSIAADSIRYWYQYAWKGLQDLPLGDYIYTVEIDSGEVVPEIDEDNNVATIYFSVVSTLPPENDDFIDADDIYNLYGMASVNNSGATLESGEPKPTAQTSSSSSVWWKWTAPESGMVRFATEGSSFDTVLAIYRGSSLATLSEVVSDDDSEAGRTSSCEFNAVAGTTYYIAVSGYSSNTGDIILSWSPYLYDYNNGLQDALDCYSLSFAVGGTGPSSGWYRGISDGTAFGKDSAVNGYIGHDKTAWVSTTVNGPGILTFRWKISSEKYYDHMDLLIDSWWQSAYISGVDGDWIYEAYKISGSGEHFIGWEYMKDDSESQGDDCAWLDQVTWTPNSPLSPIYRFYSKNYKGHFFTMDLVERDTIIANNPNWKYEGAAYFAYNNAAAGTVPVYRFYSKNYRAHFYTINEDEMWTIRYTNPNWKYEGIAYYVRPTPGNGTTPVYRFWSKAYRHHFFTTNEEEMMTIRNTNPNWKYEGIAYYAWSNPLYASAKDLSSTRASSIVSTAQRTTPIQLDGDKSAVQTLGNATDSLSNKKDITEISDLVAEKALLRAFNSGKVLISATNSPNWTLWVMPDEFIVEECGELLLDGLKLCISEIKPEDSEAAGHVESEERLGLVLKIPEGAHTAMLLNALGQTQKEVTLENGGLLQILLPVDNTWYQIFVEDENSEQSYSIWIKSVSL